MGNGVYVTGACTTPSSNSRISAADKVFSAGPVTSRVQPSQRSLSNAAAATAAMSSHAIQLTRAAGPCPSGDAKPCVARKDGKSYFKKLEKKDVGRTLVTITPASTNAASAATCASPSGPCGRGPSMPKLPMRTTCVTPAALHAAARSRLTATISADDKLCGRHTKALLHPAKCDANRSAPSITLPARTSTSASASAAEKATLPAGCRVTTRNRHGNGRGDAASDARTAATILPVEPNMATVVVAIFDRKSKLVVLESFGGEGSSRPVVEWRGDREYHSEVHEWDSWD